MPTTPTYALRFPSGDDPVDVPQDIENLAVDLEALLDGFPADNLGTAGAGDADKFLIVSDTGDVVVRALAGDVTYDDDAGGMVIGAGKVGTTELADLAVTGAKVDNETIGESKLTDGLTTILGVSDTDAVRRGKSIVAAEGTRTNVAYGALNNGPDQVSDIVVSDTSTLVFIVFQGLWRTTVSGAGRAAIFFDAVQLKRADAAQSGAPTNQEVISPTWSSSSGLGPIWSSGSGLTAPDEDADGSPPDPEYDTGVPMVLAGKDPNVETVPGLAPGNICIVRGLAAGTYDISVQWKATSGQVIARQRRLWAWTMGF